MTPELFDSHCHLTAEAFAEDLDDVLVRAAEAGVRTMTCIASTPDDARAALALCGAHPQLWTTAGVHPHEAGDVQPGWDGDVRALLDHPRVRAVGECGLDFHYDFAPREAQFEVFGRQIELAAETGLPLIVHSRTADAEMLGFLRDLPEGVRGVLHCFSGSDELLETGLAKGWYVSFAGVVTFKKFDQVEMVRRVPLDRLLIETDAPYLAPVPKRGKRNEPAFVAHTAARLAEIRAIPLEELARATTENARRFYGLEEVAP